MEKLSAVAKESQSDQLKKLKDLCEKETENLKKKMDKRWKEKFHEAKSQEKSHRVTEEKKAELKQSHVVEAVHCIRRLEDAQAKRLERLLEKHQDIQQQILDEKPKLQNDLKQEYQGKFQRLPLEIQEFLQDSAACKRKFSNDGHWNDVPISTTTEQLNHTAASPHVKLDERSSEKVFDTSL
ncbi:1-phosphatidylinositol 4,5-bisphosphate phosphodiesterase beta-1-like isoform X1 [Myxocyprinus asiaticus]|uniref:1-phosphatidylinositol 4,5-bisphosphate phosphodiesterase beta-1-like isoform X1 n=1 Tax=Myxocyprinus asiaticus TaxID=70543 RepID=UPI002222072D|nr:1-phosphatidylinositol 4,5-bisphosphate phosphodiesterase beta-1-like isoform X1 [Myxocyprinus asiaticus]